MALDYFATQVGSYSAETTRRAMFAAFARTAANSPGVIAGGLLSSADLQLTAPASGLTVNVGTGEGIIGGSEGGAQGGYYARNGATFSAVVSAANPTNPRIDAVCMTMADAGYTQPSDVGGTTNGPVIAVVTGTPTAGATLANLSGAPAIPLSTLLLGYVLVPAAATSIITANISNRATVTGLLTGSNYLQLLSTPARRLAYGTGTFSFASGGNATSQVTVPHGLGVIPSAYVAFPDARGTTSIFVAETNQAADATNMYLVGVTNVTPAANFTMNFYWFAVG